MKFTAGTTLLSPPLCLLCSACCFSALSAPPHSAAPCAQDEAMCRWTTTTFLGTAAQLLQSWGVLARGFPAGPQLPAAPPGRALLTRAQGSLKPGQVTAGEFQGSLRLEQAAPGKPGGASGKSKRCLVRQWEPQARASSVWEALGELQARAGAAI